MIRENPLCQNLTIGKRGRPKNADKILKEKNKRQKIAEEEQASMASSIPVQALERHQPQNDKTIDESKKNTKDVVLPLLP